MKKMMAAAGAALVGASAIAGTVTVYANNTGGDSFSHNLFTTLGGQAVGTSGWHYNNVRQAGVVGISNQFARNGDGSVRFALPNTNAKADIEFFAAASSNILGNASAATGSSLGKLGDLSALSYDWYRDSSSTNPAGQMPVIRLQVKNGSSTSYLVFEQAYNGGGAAALDTWMSTDVLGMNAKLWQTSAPPNFNITITQWMTDHANWDVVGISLGVGSGWAGAFLGAIDNVTFGFNGNNTTYNFEVDAQVIPSPLAGVMGAAGLFGVAGVRRRR